MFEQYNYKLKYYLLVFIFSTYVHAFTHTCYTLEKQQLLSNLPQHEGMLIDIASDRTEEGQYLEPYAAIITFDTPRYIPDATGIYLDCSKSKYKNIFLCQDDKKKETLVLAFKKNHTYFDFEKLTLSDPYSSPKHIYYVSKNKKGFIRGTLSSCYRPMDAIIKIDREPKDQQAKQLLNSLNKLKNIIIYDFDYNDKVAIAVGEDNSIEIRKEQAQDESFKSLVLYSFDKGKHWNKHTQYSIPIQKVILLQNLNALATASIEGAGGTILFTDNGGKKWKTIYDGMMIHDIMFVDNTIYASGYGIIKSEDGLHWQQLPVKENEYFGLFSPAKNSLLVGGKGEILRSQDKGKHWKRTILPDKAKKFTWVSFYQKNHLLYARSARSEIPLLFSKDKGEHWEIESPSSFKKK